MPAHPSMILLVIVALVWLAVIVLAAGARVRRNRSHHRAAGKPREREHKDPVR